MNSECRSTNAYSQTQKLTNSIILIKGTFSQRQPRY